MVTCGVEDDTWHWLLVTVGVASSCLVLLSNTLVLDSFTVSAFSPGLSGTDFAKGFGGPSTDGFSLNSDLAVCGGDEPVTVRVGVGKKGPPAAGLTGPAILPVAPSEGGRSIPLEVPLGPESVWEESLDGARMGRCSHDSVEPQVP